MDGGVENRSVRLARLRGGDRRWVGDDGIESKGRQVRMGERPSSPSSSRREEGLMQQR